MFSGFQVLGPINLIHCKFVIFFQQIFFKFCGVFVIFLPLQSKESLRKVPLKKSFAEGQSQY